MTAQQFRWLSAYCSRAYANKQAVVLCRLFLTSGYLDTVKEKKGDISKLALSRQGVSNEKVKKNAFHRVGLRNAPTMQDAANSKKDQQARKKEIEKCKANAE
jgi:hypothetical protein